MVIELPASKDRGSGRSVPFRTASQRPCHELVKPEQVRRQVAGTADWPRGTATRIQVRALGMGTTGLVAQARGYTSSGRREWAAVRAPKAGLCLSIWS